MAEEENVNSIFEKKIQNEIEELGRKIRELSMEKHALERQLLKARRNDINTRDVTRKNSLTRVLVENRVIETLSERKAATSTRDLALALRRSDYDIKDTTLRTYLHRMKLRGIIQNTGTNGRWRLPKA